MSERQAPYFSRPLRIALATARLYRGVMVYSLPDGSTVIFGECGQEYHNADQAEAQAFVDASLALSGRLIGALA